MKREVKNNFSIVIRSSAERTAEVCQYLLKKQVPEEIGITKIELKPFEAALRRSYEIGIESKKKWLVILDADVLIRDGAIQELIKKGDQTDISTFQIEGYLHDGILLKYRKGGVKLYRTELLKKAVKMIPEDGKTIRPESFTLRMMNDIGFPKKNVYLVTGLHDYKQYRKDLYRKAFIHSYKHKKEIYSTLPKWVELSKKNDDYKAILKGIFDGLMSDSEAKIDTRIFADKSQIALSQLQIQELKPITDFQSIHQFVIDTLSEQDPLFSPLDLSKFSYYYQKAGAIGVFNLIKRSASKRIIYLLRENLK